MIAKQREGEERGREDEVSECHSLRRFGRRSICNEGKPNRSVGRSHDASRELINRPARPRPPQAAQRISLSPKEKGAATYMSNPACESEVSSWPMN